MSDLEQAARALLALYDVDPPHEGVAQAIENIRAALRANLRAALAAEADQARRYRWLRDVATPSEVANLLFNTDPSTTDAAIDAAIAQETKNADADA